MSRARGSSSDSGEPSDAITRRARRTTSWRCTGSLTPKSTSQSSPLRARASSSRRASSMCWSIRSIAGARARRSKSSRVRTTYPPGPACRAPIAWSVPVGSSSMNWIATIMVRRDPPRRGLRRSSRSSRASRHASDQGGASPSTCVPGSWPGPVRRMLRVSRKIASGCRPSASSSAGAGSDRPEGMTSSRSWRMTSLRLAGVAGSIVPCAMTKLALGPACPSMTERSRKVTT